MNNQEIIYSPQFKKWFGDWQNGKKCSKVLDDKGFPLIVYHGTDNEFNEFKSEYMGQTGTALGQGFYFTSIQDDARGFGKNVKSFFLNIRKPLNSKKLTMRRNDVMILIDNIDKKQSENDPDFGYGILSDFGDVDYEGRNKVLKNAVDILLDNENDVDLVGDLINMSGDYDLVVDVLRNILGYDGIINKEKNIYVVHHANQIKEIDNKVFNSNKNNFNETVKKIRLTENQLNFLLRH